MLCLIHELKYQRGELDLSLKMNLRPIDCVHECVFMWAFLFHNSDQIFAYICCNIGYRTYCFNCVVCFAWFGLSRIFARAKKWGPNQNVHHKPIFGFISMRHRPCEFDWGEKSVRTLRWSQFFVCMQFFSLFIHRHLWLVHVYILKTCCYAISLVFIEKKYPWIILFV